MSGEVVAPEPMRGGNLFNFDKEQQQDSARKLATLGQVTLLPGHVDPWVGDLGELYPPTEDIHPSGDPGEVQSPAEK